MNKTNEIAKQLNRQIRQSEEYKMYYRSLEILKKHPELFELEKTLKNIQQQILKERTKKDGNSYELELLYRKKMDEFKNHPFIVNYLSDKEELSSLVDYVQTYIQGLLD